MYRALERMGVRGGNILEPSMGTGAFFAHKPSSFDLHSAKLYGVELDELTGRIARQLYQKARIQITGFEKADLPDSFFDCAVGNVPFGDFSVSDRAYDKLHFRIHDYFLAKTIDKVRTGGIIAMITTSGTLDKKSDTVRKYIAARCELIGAVRLPNTTFKQNAGTEAVADILFLQKRDRLVERDEAWLHIGQTEDGIPINQYFVEHPEMVCGTIKMVSGPYGPAPTCEPSSEGTLEEQLDRAMSHLSATLTKPEIAIEAAEEQDADVIEADPDVRNFSYTLKDGKIYFRTNSVMKEMRLGATADNRVRQLIALRDTVRDLLQAQLDDLPDAEIHRLQTQLKKQYDTYTHAHGLINSRGSALAFQDDSSYYLLCSLEDVDENGKLKGLSDMFTKRTIRSAKPADRADTASDALALSIGEKACVDMPYMMQLTGKTEKEIVSELNGVIFEDPLEKTPDGSPVYRTADEYLSGNVRKKLEIARLAAAKDSRFRVHVDALEQVQPKDLDASEISVRLGATWLDPAIIKQFADELVDAPMVSRRMVDVHYAPYTGLWNISGKSITGGNIKASVTYGTNRANFYHILEESLNLRAIRIFDTVRDPDGTERRVLNPQETQAAQGKQQQIEDAFKEWIWKDQNRRLALVKLYNERFNSTRPREYDGSHIQFHGMNPEITLRPHQRNAIAHILYGHNTLLGHVVGAGKTYEMVAAAMEKKRLGLCSKTLICVPNHLTEQMASEALQLYPNANILVAKRTDFEKANRKRFCGRIATGNYDIIVIGHSQFERIPLSNERQALYLQKQIDEVIEQTAMLKREHAENFTVKQMERTRKQLEKRLEKLNNTERKDDVVTFEELGVDSLMVDEAHMFKNLMCVSKMRNVAGISQTESQRASDLLMKTMYLDEITGGRGVTFATGTPLSNSMTELYTMQRYLQRHTLEVNGLANFDAWASTFGETVTAIELAPEGTGYRVKTRFAKFYNLPELMAMFKECADIQTADMLKLPVPELEGGKPINVQLQPSSIQRVMVADLGKRADIVRNGSVDPKEDNMLKIVRC
ncbi:DEAD/DEAH box helicase family protein [bacterium]|nr:DEAD/DEAH box helicase family protein [bacterium]